MYTSSCSLPATIMLICAADHGASAHAHACRPMALLARKTTNVALRDNNLPSLSLLADDVEYIGIVVGNIHTDTLLVTDERMSL